MMHNFTVEYSELGLALSSLSSRKFYELSRLVYQYARASAVDPDAPFPTTDDPKIEGFLYAVCTRIQACTIKHEGRSQTNQRNANARWSKTKDDHGAVKSKEIKQDAPKVKAPITLKQFMGLVEDADHERVKKLYHELETANWVYHGHQLSGDDGCMDCVKRCYADNIGGRCGWKALIYYNAVTKSERALEIFNALCDLGAERRWDFCDVCLTMTDVRMRRGLIVYKSDDDTENEYDTVENFIEALRKGL